MSGFSSVPLDCVGKSDGLFYAYVHDSSSLRNRYMMIFASPDICDEWWEAISKHVEFKYHWKRPSVQMFAFEGEAFDLSIIWKHEDFRRFHATVFHKRIADGDDRSQSMPVLPVQWADGFAVGNKFVHTVTSHLPGHDGHIDPEKEKGSRDAVHHINKVRGEMEDKGIAIRW